MSLLCRLKKLVHKGELEEKDLERIVILPKDATNGDVITAMFPKAEVIAVENEEMEIIEYVVKIDTETPFTAEWWNSPYRKEQE